MHRSLLASIAVVIGLAAAGDSLVPRANAASACTTSGTVTATYITTGPFTGLWQYCFSASWDTGGAGLSHISFLVNYECDCCSINGLTVFDTPAGTSTGADSNGPCEAQYIGLGDLCDADPTIPSTNPAIKFEQIESDCEAQQTGSGTFCFYSVLPPAASTTYPGAVAVKYGTSSCFGDLTGQMPDCTSCGTVGTDKSTWGGVKAKYKK